MYVSINAYLLHLTYICWGRQNFHHSMLANSGYNNISIENYNQEIMNIFMLSLRLYVTSSLALVYLEIISNIQCYISQGRQILQNNKCKGMLPTNMLAYVVNLNRFVSDVYMDNISNMIYQLHHSHSEQFFNQQQHYENCLHLCYHYCVSTSAYVYTQGW